MIYTTWFNIKNMNKKLIISIFMVDQSLLKMNKTSMLSQPLKSIQSSIIQ